MVVKRLALKSFGKFTDANFDFQPVNVFIGANEAGKTTLFDALHKSLANPSKTTKAGKRLKERYGEAGEVSVELTQPTTFDADAFLNLHAVRAGDLLLEMTDRADWMQIVKARLFSGGINPETLLKRFEDLGSTAANRVHMRELVALEKREAELIALLQTKQQLRETILKRENELKTLDTSVAAAEAQRLKIATAIETLEKDLLIEDKLKKRHAYQAELKRFYRLRDLRQELHAHKDFASHDLARLEALVAEEQSLSTDLKVERAREETLRSHLLGIQRQVTEEAGAIEQKQQLVSLAHQLQKRLDQLIANPPYKRAGRWDPYTLVFTCLVISATAFIGVNSPLSAFLNLKPEYRPYGMTVGVVLAVVFLFLSYRRETVKDEDKENEEVAKLCGEWVLKGPAPLGPTAAALHDILQLASQADKPHVVNLTKLKVELQEHTAQAEKQRQTVEKLAATVNEVDQQIATLLRSKNVRDVASYRQSAQAYQQLEQQLQDNFADLSGLSTNDAAIAEQIRDIERRLNYLDEEGIVGDIKTDSDVTRLKQKLTEYKQSLAAALQTEAAARSTQARTAGEIDGEFRQIPSQLLEIERDLNQNREAIEKLKISREAALFAAGIFKSMTEDNQLRFRQLALEVEKLLEAVDYKARVEINKLTVGDIAITDAGGTVRSFEQLSTGTRDLFLLAARLVLLQHSQSPGLLILDEPFTALDTEREKLAVKLLASYQKVHGTQLIFFTKAQDLVEILCGTFAECAVVRLEK